MTEGIMIAIITGCLAAIPTIIAVVVNNAKTIYRIDVLEKKFEKHNPNASFSNCCTGDFEKIP